MLVFACAMMTLFPEDHTVPVQKFISCCNKCANLVLSMSCQSEFITWLVIAIVISESTKVYKSRKNSTIIINKKRICGKEIF